MNAGTKLGNLRAAATPLVQALLSLTVGDFAAATEKLGDAQKALAADDRPPERVLWEQAFALALVDALRTARVHVQQDRDELATAVADFLATAFASETGFGEVELLDPTGFAAYAPVRDAFPAFVRRIDPAYAVEPDERLRERLDAGLRKGLVRAWSDDVPRFQVIVDRLQGPIAEGARRNAAWMKHYAWVRTKFEREPVFAPDDPLPVRLEQVYVRLRCVWHEVLDDEADAPARSLEPRKRRAHVGLLHEAVRGWLDAAAADDPIRLVAGGPGSGKSSFARAFATEAILETGWRVVVVELQHLRLAGDLRSDLRHYFDHRKASGAGFPADPLDWYANGADKCLFVFDGLDELAGTEAGATELTRRFVANLKVMLHLARADQRPLKALVLGRSAAAEEARRNADLDLGCLLHALPLHPPTRDDLLLGGNAKAAADVIDEAGLLAAADVDQRRHYWQRWQAAHGAPAEPAPEGLTHRTLAGLTAEPLLLHLLLVSGYLTPEHWQAAADNRNVVYAAIFTKVYERDRRAGKWTAAQIDEGDFFTLMECLGLAAWAGGGRTGNEDEFLRLRELHAAGRRERKFETLGNTDLRSVALQFYTRRDLDEPGYEFIHKSFAEYLIARALLAAARRAHDDLQRDANEDVAVKWARIAGLAEVTTEILDFLRDEVRLLPLDEAVTLKEPLQDLMSWTLRHGMPAHKASKGGSFRDVEIRQRHAEGALLAVLNALARRIAQDDAAKAAIALDWPHALALKQLLERQRIGRLHFPLATAFDHLGWHTASADGDHVVAVRRHQLNISDLSFVSIRNANLDGAELVCANLVDADLRDADLGGAKLYNADLRDVDLEGANLRNAFLVDANLRSANLQGANLSHSDLRAAQGLTQAQVDAAIGNERTVLPPGLRRPASWTGG